jgi:hypothetical protein
MKFDHINVIYCPFIITVMKLILLQWKSANMDLKSHISAFTNTVQPSRQQAVKNV